MYPNPNNYKMKSLFSYGDYFKGLETSKNY